MPEDKPVIDNNVRAAWNDYVQFLKGRGIAGSPELDKNDLGNQMLNMYLRQNPGSFLKPELIKPIQEDFANYRNYALDKVRQGKAAFGEGVNEDNFMADLSKLDAWPGSYTTRHTFPSEYMNYLDEKGRLLKTENKGFASTNK